MADWAYLYMGAIACAALAIQWLVDLLECNGWLMRIYNGAAIIGVAITAFKLVGMA